ncbi:MAG: hypothetical protein ABGW97_09735 [Christiangramia sp.]|uniref:hypothetical protein n=1 Tax=Christiangramia sp. TaxID=1931228 RepID=UPI003241E598
MGLKTTLDQRNFPDRYQKYIDRINLEKANDFVIAILNSIINKYGKEELRRQIEIDSSHSKISDHLTHIIEIGGLKIIADNNLLVEDRREFQHMIVSVIFVLNCSLAIEAGKLNVYRGPNSHYYNSDSIMTLASRLANHVIKGRTHQNGFEYFANVMVMEGLISEFSAY